MKTLRIAHRGASGYALENSMEAFQISIKDKVDMIELDVRVCKTGEPIVMHDTTVDRTTNGTGKIKDLSLKELKEMRLTNNQPIPTLAEVVDFCAGKTTLNLDIKTYKAVKPVVLLLQKYISQKILRYEDIVLASANILTLRKIYLLDPHFRLSVIIRYLPRIVTRFTYRFKPFSVQPISKITTKKLVNELQKKDIKVFPWALKVSDDGKNFIQKMARLNPDGIISFFPEKITKKKR